jgi:SAM-dependent methyltransferase
VDRQSGPNALDISVPNVARMYDYWLGGRENFQADRTTAERLVRLIPGIREWARDNRAFLRRAVRYLAEQGIDQFLDIGTGMPTRGAVHEVASEVNPDVRVAYVDYDPVVVSHGRALLTKAKQAIVVQADLRQPGVLLDTPAIREHFDFDKPVAVILLAVLHFVSDKSDPAGIVATLRDSLAPGSYFVIGHVTGDKVPGNILDRGLATWKRTSADIWPRRREQILRFFDGLDLVEPGLVPEYAWRQEPAEGTVREYPLCLAGVARKALADQLPAEAFGYRHLR